jgi:hypothetical protein
MKIQLTEWGERNYSPPPSHRILRAWAASGQLLPTPEKVGRIWMVDEHTIRVAIPETSDLSRMSERAKHIFKTT